MAAPANGARSTPERAVAAAGGSGRQYAAPRRCRWCARARFPGLSRLTPVAKRLWTIVAELPSPGSFERDAENAPQTGCSGLAIDLGQCAEPLRISCIHRGDLRGTHDRWGGETSGAEIRYAYVTRPTSVLGTGDHDQP